MTGGRRFGSLDWGPDHLCLDAVVAYVDGELGDGAHERADLHLAGCPRCRAEVVAQRQARAALRTAAGPQLPPSLLHTLRAIPVETELPAPPPGLAVTADGQFVLLRDVPPATGPDGGPVDGEPRRSSRRAVWAGVSGLAIGALAFGALTAAPPVAPAPGGLNPVLGGAVLNVPNPASAGAAQRPREAEPSDEARLSDQGGLSDEALARLDAGAAAPRAVPAAVPTGSADSAAGSASAPSAPSAEGAVDAAVRQRLDRTPAVFLRDR